MEINDSMASSASKLHKNLFAVALLVSSFATFENPALAGATSQSLDMSYEACIALIQATAEQVGQAPINVVETSELRIVRFITSDGSVLVSCSRPDGKAVITQSD